MCEQGATPFPSSSSTHSILLDSIFLQDAQILRLDTLELDA